MPVGSRLCWSMGGVFTTQRPVFLVTNKMIKQFPSSSEALHRVISRIGDVTVLVVGDFILDRFVNGVIERISPEAPIPVLHGRGETLAMGGAGNVVSNIISLGARAVVQNPDHVLIPGQFVRAVILGIHVKNGITIPKAALMQAPQMQFVYVVKPDNSVELRPVTVARELANDWLIGKGLNPGDRVVTEGVIKVVPGGKVQPVDAAAAGKKQASSTDAGKQQAAGKQ